MIVAIERSNAVNRFRPDGGRQLAGENRFVAVDPAPPERRIGSVVGELAEIDGEVGERGLQRAQARVGLEAGFAITFCRRGENIGKLVARSRTLLRLAFRASDAARQPAQTLARRL